MRLGFNLDDDTMFTEKFRNSTKINLILACNFLNHICFSTIVPFHKDFPLAESSSNTAN